MTMMRVTRFALALALATGALMSMAPGASARSPWPLVSSHLPTTLHECSPHQAASGGASYTNLWSLKLTVVDLAAERVFTNAKGGSVANPRLVLRAAPFSTVLAPAFRGERAVIEDALGSDLRLPRVSSLPAAKVIAAGRRHVAARHSLVVYATTTVDISQGFFSRVSRGCNARGSLQPWVLSAVAAGALTYHSATVPTTSLVARTYQPPASVPLAFVQHLVTHLSPSSTGPLPTGFGFPKLQTELLRNDSVVAYSGHGRGSVFLGWLKARLPVTNRLNPFSISVVRTASW